jgi:hypothetical protein
VANQLSAPAAVSLAKSLYPRYEANKRYAATMDSWVKGTPPMPVMPADASAEYRELQKRSVTPWLGLVVTSIAQALYVEGHRQSNSNEDSALWKALWQPNSLDSRPPSTGPP